VLQQRSPGLPTLSMFDERWELAPKKSAAKPSQRIKCSALFVTVATLAGISGHTEWHMCVCVRAKLPKNRGDTLIELAAKRERLPAKNREKLTRRPK